MPINTKSLHEQQQFDSSPAVINHKTGAQSISAILNQPNPFSDDDIRELAGAPAHGIIDYQDVPAWGNTGYDQPLPGLYFFSKHSVYITGVNRIGLCFTPPLGYVAYIKDVFFNKQAPIGMCAIMLARIVRFCLRFNITRIRLLAAGGREWETQPFGRWGGYYAWARLGFDMNLLPPDLLLATHFPYFPSHLSGCGTVQEVVQNEEGRDWWKMCGTGDFMEFDSSPASPALATLDAYLGTKGF